jgi:hypothetical protein
MIPLVADPARSPILELHGTDRPTAEHSTCTVGLLVLVCSRADCSAGYTHRNQSSFPAKRSLSLRPAHTPYKERTEEKPVGRVRQSMDRKEG